MNKHTLLNAVAIGAANGGVSYEFGNIDVNQALLLEANFTYGAGGTKVIALVSTSLDDGTTWTQIAQFAFTTAAARKAVNLSALTPVTTVYDATTALADNTCKDGVIGRKFKVDLTTTGTYTGATALTLTAAAR